MNHRASPNKHHAEATDEREPQRRSTANPQPLRELRAPKLAPRPNDPPAPLRPPVRT